MREFKCVYTCNIVESTVDLRRKRAAFEVILLKQVMNAGVEANIGALARTG